MFISQDQDWKTAARMCSWHNIAGLEMNIIHNQTFNMVIGVWEGDPTNMFLTIYLFLKVQWIQNMLWIIVKSTGSNNWSVSYCTRLD